MQHFHSVYERILKAGVDASKIEVIGAGPYAGVKGKRCHVKNKRHIDFNVPGVCTVCTPYIPTEFLREII